MSITSDQDWRGLREVGRIVRDTLDALAQRVRPGMTTGDLDLIALGVFEANGARSAPALTYGFPGTVLISVNDEIERDNAEAAGLQNEVHRFHPAAEIARVAHPEERRQIDAGGCR